MDIIYHVYLKNKCISHSLNEIQFQRLWNYLHITMGRSNGTEYSESDLSYERLTLDKLDKDNILNSSY